jgi:hypothetical protein
MKDVLSQFSKSEFFSVLPPGFYIFVIIYSCLVLDLGGTTSPKSLFDVFDLLANLIYQQPAYIIFILFASYMLGSIFRALPVRWAEKSIPPFNVGFPYSNFLHEVLGTLNDNIDATKHIESKLPHWKGNLSDHVFNYWKDALCVNSIEGFEYYQTFETRVRFFCGMIWASWFGIIGSLYIIIRLSDITHNIGLPLFLLSLILIITFGSNFRRVRKQEAKALLLIFSAYLQNR